MHNCFIKIYFKYTLNHPLLKNYFSTFLFAFLFVASNAQSTNFSTKLPLLIIQTDNQKIVDEPKITASLKIIYNGDQNHKNDVANVYNGQIGIEIRGKTSAGYPQKPYLFETRNSDGSNNNVSLLGMPEENDWCLLSFYNDKSFARNTLAFELFRQLENYSIRSRLCEVILNNEYQGIYLLTENVKRDKNRIDIATLKDSDNAGEELTGGYIFKVDYSKRNDSWTSLFRPWENPNRLINFVYHYPDWDEITNAQKTYIRNYVDDFETELYSDDFEKGNSRYNDYIDVNSFIDYFLINETARNLDGFKKSCYFHKDKNGKLIAGPVWDFDWAWKNINHCVYANTNGSGWVHKINDCNPDLYSPNWMKRLFQDPQFTDLTRCRFEEYRATVLKDENIHEIIDSIAGLVSEAQTRHFQKYNILGRNVGAPEIDYQPASYSGEVEKLKQWVTRRMQWLDSNIPGNCITTKVDDSLAMEQTLVYPNPVKDKFYVKTRESVKELKLYNITGKLVLETGGDKLDDGIKASNLTPGIYMLHIINIDNEVLSRKIVKY